MSVAKTLLAELKLPVIAAPMFLISGPRLVIAAAEAGIIGAFPAPNARTIADLEAWLQQITGTLGDNKNWAMNMIVHNSYDRFDAELALVEEYQPKILITALGSPKRATPRVHAFGGLVFCDVITPEQARKAADAGVDGLILVCAGAGGHTGQYSPFAFVEEVRQFWPGPLALAGAIGSARGIKAAQILGADFAYMGTSLIACPESLITDENRAMLVRAGMADVKTTAAISGVPANWLRESLEAAGFTPEMLKAEKKVDFSNLHGDSKAWKTIWGAGHSVGRTTRVQTVAEVVAALAADYAAL